jgi:hypothetical protein
MPRMDQQALDAYVRRLLDCAGPELGARVRDLHAKGAAEFLFVVIEPEHYACTRAPEVLGPPPLQITVTPSPIVAIVSVADALRIVGYAPTHLRRIVEQQLRQVPPPGGTKVLVLYRYGIAPLGLYLQPAGSA